MIDARINEEYFSWMCDKVCGERFAESISYRKLLTFLHDVEFIWILPMDKNRADNGLSLRRSFVLDVGYEDHVAEYISGPCSILEMMIALAIHMEDIMDDYRYGNRTGQWFWGMVRSLGLNGMYDLAYDEDHVQEVILKFLNRDYEPDGRGGLFTIRGCYEDLRDVEISVQRNWYLNTID